MFDSFAECLVGSLNSSLEFGCIALDRCCATYYRSGNWCFPQALFYHWWGLPAQRTCLYGSASWYLVSRLRFGSSSSIAICALSAIFDHFYDDQKIYLMKLGTKSLDVGERLGALLQYLITSWKGGFFRENCHNSALWGRRYDFAACCFETCYLASSFFAALKKGWRNCWNSITGPRQRVISITS